MTCGRKPRLFLEPSSIPKNIFFLLAVSSWALPAQSMLRPVADGLCPSRKPIFSGLHALLPILVYVYIGNL